MQQDPLPQQSRAHGTGVLTLLSAPDCHLCAHARAVLEELSGEADVRWREVSTDSTEGKRLAAAAPPLRPVLLSADGRVLAYGRLSKRRLRKDLAILHEANGAEPPGG